MNGGGCSTNGLPYTQAPPPLARFSKQSGVESDADGAEIYLYHGTNCYRRWEIKRAGNILPGRSGYSFFCSRQADAFTYARAACRRDIGTGQPNSLIAEPVVLKVRFTARTWMQADFVQQECLSGAQEDRAGMSVAFLGPIPSSYVVDVLHCCHGRRLGTTSGSARSFADGTLSRGIRRLRSKTGDFRLDTFLLLKLGALVRAAGVWLYGKRQPQLTTVDELRRLCQAQSRR